jgi:hypothetical protein
MPHIQQPDKRTPIAIARTVPSPKIPNEPISPSNPNKRKHLAIRRQPHFLSPLTGEPLGSLHQSQEFAAEPKSLFIFSHLHIFVDPNEPKEPKPPAAVRRAFRTLFAAIRPRAASIK